MASVLSTLQLLFGALLSCSGHLQDYEELADDPMEGTGGLQNEQSEEERIREGEQILGEDDGEEDEDGEKVKEREPAKRSTGGDSGSETGSGTVTAAGLPRIYHTIHADRRETMAIKSLKGEAISVDCGSFITLGDNRIQGAQLRSSYSRRMNMSSSFHLETLACVTCDPELEHSFIYPAQPEEGHGGQLSGRLCAGGPKLPRLPACSGGGGVLKGD